MGWNVIVAFHGHTFLFLALNGLQREKICPRGLAKNKGADQSAHPHSLISTFVIQLLERIISRIAKSEISIFQLVSVAEETG